MTKLSMFGPSSPAGTVPGRRARRFALLALWGLTGVGLLTGCAGREGGSNFNFLTTPAYGRPDTCPDDAVDPGGPGGGPMAARCSYANASGEMMQLRGSVLLEVSPFSQMQLRERLQKVTRRRTRVRSRASRLTIATIRT